jgi:hypothetical protein
MIPKNFNIPVKRIRIYSVNENNINVLTKYLNLRYGIL